MNRPFGHFWQSAQPPHPALSICVVVPARDEASGLIGTLESLRLQRLESNEAFDADRFEVLLLANNCADETASIARAYAQMHPGFRLHVENVKLPLADAHIGMARKLLMDAACERLGRVPGSTGIIASTDADTWVDAHWLAHTFQEVEWGADAVGGRITLNPSLPVAPSALRRQRSDAAHRLVQSRLEDLVDPDPADPWPRHHQHFCASLAVTRQAYLKVGGIPAVRYLEDEALIDSLRRADLRIRHSPRVRVVTSPRSQGRVEVGLSWQLRQWEQTDEDSAPPMVDDADALAARWAARRLLRAHRSGSSTLDWEAVCDRVRHCYDVEASWLRAQVGSAETFGSLWEDIESHGPRVKPPPQVPLRQAIERTHALIHALVQAQGAASAARSKTSSRYVHSRCDVRWRNDPPSPVDAKKCA